MASFEKINVSFEITGQIRGRGIGTQFQAFRESSTSCQVPQTSFFFSKLLIQRRVTTQVRVGLSGDDHISQIFVRPTIQIASIEAIEVSWPTNCPTQS